VHNATTDLGSGQREAAYFSAISFLGDDNQESCLQMIRISITKRSRCDHPRGVHARWSTAPLRCRHWLIVIGQTGAGAAVAIPQFTAW